MRVGQFSADVFVRSPLAAQVQREWLPDCLKPVVEKLVDKSG